MRIETTARPMQCKIRRKSRSRGLDTVFRGVYPEPVEGLQAPGLSSEAYRNLLCRRSLPYLNGIEFKSV